jgi:starch-binding outer membrane protein, SusD/RagB family
MKKLFNFKYSVVLLGFAAMLFATSCKDLIEGYSTDPVNITDPSVIETFKYLSGAEVNLIGAYEGDVNRTTGLWTGHFSGEDRQYIGLSNYSVTGRDFDTEWAAIYAGVLKNTKLMKTKAKFEGNFRVIGIGQVLDAMALGLAADLWGDVPFTEATQYPEIKNPKYDPQAEVYAGVQAKLDSAIANLAVEVPDRLIPTDADFYFGGDGPTWIRVANTLKARYYLHVGDYANAIIYSDPAIAISSAAENMMAPHGPDYQFNFNLFYSFLTYDRPGYMGANSYTPKLLDPSLPTSRNNDKTNENGRFNYFYAPLAYWGGLNTGAEYDPNVLVDFDWGTPPEYNGFFGATTSFPLVTFEENMLIRAESFAKLNNFAQALASLNSLRAYFDTGAQFGTSTAYTTEFGQDFDPDLGGGFYKPYVAADFSPGGMENAGGKTPIDALITEILEERYVTLTGQLEVFNDVRRTHNYLALPVVAGYTTFPQRVLYPQSEQNANAQNVPTVTITDPTPVNADNY